MRYIVAAAEDLLPLYDVLRVRSVSVNELHGVIQTRRQSRKGYGWIRGETTSHFLCCARGGDNDDVDDDRSQGFPFTVSHTTANCPEVGRGERNLSSDTRSRRKDQFYPVSKYMTKATKHEPSE